MRDEASLVIERQAAPCQNKLSCYECFKNFKKLKKFNVKRMKEDMTTERNTWNMKLEIHNKVQVLDNFAFDGFFRIPEKLSTEYLHTVHYVTRYNKQAYNALQSLIPLITSDVRKRHVKTFFIACINVE